MVDRPPPQRYRIIERGGRLEVLDSETGGRPQSAAERMAIHDAAHGHAALRYDRMADDSAGAAMRPAPPPAAVPKPEREPARDPIRAALEQRTPLTKNSVSNRPQLGAQSAAEAHARPRPDGAKGPSRASPRGAKAPIVTGKWWDAKGPRTLDLGDRGRQRLTSGFVTALVFGSFLATVLLIIQPILLMVVGFLMFRFGANILAPLGARLVDEAIKADGGGR